MALKAKTPELKDKRLKMMLYGPAGVGKTTAAISFPYSYVIDMERGCDQYAATLKASHSVLLQTTSPDEVKADIKSLLTEKHPYKTLVIDPVTILYGALQEKWTRLFEQYEKKPNVSDLQDFGPRYWSRVKAEYKGIMRMLMNLDMNLILISHQKDRWSDADGKLKVVGVTIDSMRGDDYIFDYIFYLKKDTGGQRMAMTEKERAEIGKAKFPASFAWDYKNFVSFYGKEELEREATPMPMATAEQVIQVKDLLSRVKVEDTFEADCLNKADVDDWSEMPSDKIGKVIDLLTKKLGGKNV